MFSRRGRYLRGAPPMSRCEKIIGWITFACVMLVLVCAILEMIGLISDWSKL